jgi:type IV pilus assembly protein PilV
MLKIKQSGFTLLEVMVAVFVLSVGLLGLAHLQITALKTTQSADLRTQASMYASDILNRMRANRIASQTGAYNIDATDDTPSAGGNVASQDLNEWRTSLSQALPGGAGGVSCPAFDNLNEFICTVTIQWRDIHLGNVANIDYNELAVKTLTMEGAL